MLFVVAHRKVLQPRCSPAAAVLPRHGKAPVQGIWIQAEAGAGFGIDLRGGVPLRPFGKMW